jgi:hypothetical protein
MDQIGIGCNFSPPFAKGGMKGESIPKTLFSPYPSFQKEGKDIRSPTGKPDEPKQLFDDCAGNNPAIVDLGPCR